MHLGKHVSSDPWLGGGHRTADPPRRVQAPEQRGWKEIKIGSHTGKQEIPVRDESSWAAPAGGRGGGHER